MANHTTNAGPADDPESAAGESEYERTKEYLLDAVEDLDTTITPGDIVIDLGTGQTGFVSRIIASDLVEFYLGLNAHDRRLAYANLLAYGANPYLPVSIDDTVYEVVYVTSQPKDVHKSGKDYAMPRGRLARYPVEKSMSEAGKRMHGYADAEDVDE